MSLIVPPYQEDPQRSEILKYEAGLIFTHSLSILNEYVGHLSSSQAGCEAKWSCGPSCPLMSAGRL